MKPDLETLTGHIRLLGLLAILISIATWVPDLTGLIYICPYCRTERSVIGLIGLLMMLPNPGHWLSRYLGSVLGVLGLVVAGMQNFRGWRAISEGKMIFDEHWFIDPFLLSGAAIFIITGQVLLLYATPPRV